MNTMWTRWAIAVVSALAFALLTLGVPLDWPFRRHETVARGTACPADAKPANLNFTLKDMNNQEVRLSDFKGKVILLDFWATWCGPCKIEIPWFAEFQQKYGPAGPAGRRHLGRRHARAARAVRDPTEHELRSAAGPRARRCAGGVRPDVGSSRDRADLTRRQDLREARRHQRERGDRGRDQIAPLSAADPWTCS